MPFHFALLLSLLLIKKHKVMSSAASREHYYALHCVSHGFKSIAAFPGIVVEWSVRECCCAISEMRPPK